MAVGTVIVLAATMFLELLVAVKQLYVQVISLLSDAIEGEDTWRDEKQREPTSWHSKQALCSSSAWSHNSSSLSKSHPHVIQK